MLVLEARPRCQHRRFGHPAGNGDFPRQRRPAEVNEKPIRALPDSKVW